MYVQQAICLSIDHHDEFGTSVNHSFLRVQQILEEVL